MHDRIDHIALLGAGALWPAHVGTMSALFDSGMLDQLQTVVGVSVGSLVGLQMCLYLKRADAVGKWKREIRTMDTRHVLFDQDVSDCAHVMQFGTGYFRAHNLIHYVRNLLEKEIGNPDATFVDLFVRTGLDFTVMIYEHANRYSLDLWGHNGSRPRFLNYTSTPLLPVWIAIRASCSAAPIITSVKLRGQDSWWFDPALVPTYSDVIEDHFRKRGGHYLCVAIDGTDTYDITSFISKRWESTFAETMLYIVVAMLDPRDHRRADAHTLVVPVPSYPLNFGINDTITNAQMYRLARRRCLKRLKKRELLRPVRRPEETPDCQTYVVPRVSLTGGDTNL